MDEEYWAHVAGEGESLRSHALTEHLRDVGGGAGKFAGLFGSAAWAEAAGRWHDLGKFRPPFQHKLRIAGGVDAHLPACTCRRICDTCILASGTFETKLSEAMNGSA
ncbi:hypothetical protein OS176_06945 [Xanthomonadaceae bacterium XH05]|nr:hypothetical protein [Xanthomonadaceae bacterium XH05]